MRNYLTILMFFSNSLASTLEFLIFLTVNETTLNYPLFFYQMTVFGTTVYR